MIEEKYMKLALDLAEKGRGKVSPNPLVGAVIVKDNTIIGQGFHAKFGGPHAERNALAACKQSPAGADLYVTLEPCCHWGKTPPCTEAIIQSGITRVFIGSNDPNPAVSGKGIEILRNSGVEVITGILQKECDQLNQVFFHYINTGMPYVIMKYAMTLDGKIASCCGRSKWITGETARKKVHHDRHNYSAVMVGVGTVIADDPLLTCRIPGGENPVRIICDTHLRTPPGSKIITTAHETQTIIATCCTEPSAYKLFQESGCKLLTVSEKEGHVDLTDLMKQLGQMGIDSVIIEGGGTLNWSALRSGVVCKVQAYIGALLLGGDGAKSPIGGTGAMSPQTGVQLSVPQVTVLGQDILLESEVLSCLQES